APPKSADKTSAAIITPAIIVSSGNSCLLRRRVWTRRHLSQQQPNRDHRQKNVEHGERDERHDESGHRRDGFARAHHSINDPWLPPDFSHAPASLDRYEAERRCGYEQAQKPLRIQPFLIAPAAYIPPCSPKREE